MLHFPLFLLYSFASAKNILQEHPESGHMEDNFFWKPGLSENTFVLSSYVMITWLGQNLKLSFLWISSISASLPAPQAAAETPDALLISSPQYGTSFPFAHNPCSF